VAGCPFRASEVTLERTTSAIRLLGCVDIQNDARDLAPVGVVRFGVEKTHVRDGVLLVVRRKHRLVGRQICNFWIMRRHHLKHLWS